MPSGSNGRTVTPRLIAMPMIAAGGAAPSCPAREAMFPGAAAERERPPQVLAMAAIRPQIEAEIPFLHRVVRRWYRDAADADDLVQDTLLRAMAGAHLWQPGSNLRAWLVTIMRNQFLAAVAHDQRSRRAMEMLDFGNGNAAPAVEARLMLRDVERVFRRLPAKQRAALLLAGVEGKSYADAARIMGLTADAVRCHLARARDRLRSAVNRPDETSWLRSAAGRTGALLATVLCSVSLLA